MHTRRSLLGGVAGVAVMTALGTGKRLALAASGGQRPLAMPQPAPPSPVQDNTPQTTDVMASSLLGPMATLARWAYVLDDTTGTVLMEKAADEPMAPSSLTKMMTAYVAFTFLAAGRLHLEQSLPVSDKAWRMQGSKMFVPNGGSVLVSDLIQGMVIQSGNDACIVLAESIAGSEERFADMMNKAARRMGLRNSHFMNATGWPADNHYMCARDVGTLAARLIRDFPQYYHYFGEKDFTFNHIHQGNRNVLVYKGLADGLKTGHTDAGGFGLCASSLRNGRRVIVVINGIASNNERAHEGERLMSWAFNSFDMVTFFRKGQVVERAAPVWMGTRKSVRLLAAHDVKATLPMGWRAHTRITVAYPAPMPAPVTAGQRCGEVVVHLPDQSEKRVPLKVAASVEKLGMVGQVMTHLGLGSTQ